MEREQIRSQIQEFSLEERPPRPTEEELREWVERIDFKELGFENVDKSLFGLRGENYDGPLQVALQKVSIDDPSWELARKLIEIKDLRSIGKQAFDPSQHIALTQLSSYFSIGSISRAIHREKQLVYDSVRNTAAALYMVNVEFSIPEDIKDEFVDDKVEIYKGLIQKRKQFRQIAKTNSFKCLAEEIPVVEGLINGLISQNTIIDYLKNVGIEEPPYGADSYFERFISKGIDDPRMFNLLRHSIYADWLTHDDLYLNPNGLFLYKMAKGIYKDSKETQESSALYNYSFITKHFLNYMVSKDLEYLCQNEYLKKEDLSPILNQNKNNLMEVYLETGLINRFHLPFSNFVKSRLSEARDPRIREISEVLGLKYSTSKRVYAAGINLADYLLSSSNYDNATVKTLREKPLEKIYDNYRKKVSDENSK